MNARLKNIVLIPMNVLYRINPKAETKLLFFIKLGYRLNLQNPVTFNEKIQWIKFYDRNDLMPVCSDKYEVRDYIRQRGGGKLLIPLLWEGSEVEEIPFAALPDQFVIKVTHGSGFNIICRDKNKLNIIKVKKQLKRWLNDKYIPCYGEWFYGKVKPRIIIEEFLEEGDNKVPCDYKVYCFNGTPKYIQVHVGRFTDHKMKLYDLDWRPIDYVKMKYACDPEVSIKKPLKLKEMIEYAKKIAQPFHLARVDFYIIKDKIYFGEITFTDGAGFDRITPRSFDIALGKELKLPVNQPQTDESESHRKR